MPPRTKKREAEEYEEDDFVANDGDSDGPVIRSKKPKTATTTTTTTTSSRGAGAGSSKAANGGLVDSNGDVYWELSRLRRVTVSQFKGKTMVNVREYYERDGEELPGKKGISMPIPQYQTFLTLLPKIERVLKEKGESVSRPDYDGEGHAGDGDEVVEGDDDDGDGLEVTKKKEGTNGLVVERKKKNIDATSDEDEDGD